MLLSLDINSLHDCVVSSSKRHLVNKETEYIAQIVKHKRHVLDYTLQETSKGICCVSYLSKLENLYVPSINEEYLPLLCEKLDIKEELSKSFVSEEVLSKAFKAYFSHKYDRLKEIYESIDAPCFSASSGIITCLYMLSKNNYTSCNEIFQSLDVIKGAMKFYEASLFIYAVSEYSIRLNNYKEAYEFLINLDDINIRDNYLASAIYENNIRVSFHLRNDIRFMYFYNKLKNLNFLGFPMNHNFIIQSMYDCYIARSFKYINLDSFSQVDYSLIDSDVIDEIKYYGYLSQAEMLHEDEYNLKLLFDKIVTTEKELIKIPVYVALLAYIAYLINELEYYEKLDIINHNSIVITLDTPDIRFTNFVLLYASDLSNENLVDHAKETIINNLEKEQNYIYSYVYKECYENALLVLNKYRDVCLIEKSYKNTSHIRDRRIYSFEI